MTLLYEQKSQRLRQQILDEIRENLEEAETDMANFIHKTLQREDYIHPMTFHERAYLEKYLYQSIQCYDIIQDLIEDDEVTEIMVNGPKDIFYEKKGQLFPWEMKFYSEEQLMDLIQQIVGKYDKRVNASTPIVDTRLPDGSRVHIVLPPVSTNGPVLTIRKFTKENMGLSDLVRRGALPEWLAAYLVEKVRNKDSIFISGGTGSGKTTLLNALTEYISPKERVITIEDSKELSLKNCPNWVSLECKPPNLEGDGEITIRDLLKATLRMRPDRLVLGEVRGGECMDLLQLLNTGHSGSLSSGHANSCEDMLSRLETMALMGMELPILVIRRQIAAGIKVLVHMQRDQEGRRMVTTVKEVEKMEGEHICLKTIYISNI